MEAIQIEDFLHYANLGKLKAKGQKLVWVKGLPDAGKKRQIPLHIRDLARRASHPA